MNIKLVRSTNQMIHCGIYDLNGNLRYWMIVIYALNQLEQRKMLWKDIEDLNCQQQGPWFLMGDFNNVLKTQDMIGEIW